MIYLILLWFVTWCLVRLVKTDPAVTVIVLVALILGLILVFGFPHARA